MGNGMAFVRLTQTRTQGAGINSSVTLLAGQWYVFDPTDGIASDRIVVVARGREAADAPVTAIFGRVAGRSVRVECAATVPAPEVGPGAGAFVG